MKTRKRFLSLALCLVLCLGALPTAAMAAGNPIDHLKGVVYYGDVKQCRMSSAQALTYANTIEGAIRELERKNERRITDGGTPGDIHSYAALFDLGNGNPAVLFAAGLVTEYKGTNWSKDIRADGCDWGDIGDQKIWQYEDGHVKFFSVGKAAHIALHSGYLFLGGLTPDAATRYRGKVYPLGGGKISSEASTWGEYNHDIERDLPVVYYVDGNVVTEAEFKTWQTTWEKSAAPAGHWWTGGVGGTITGLGDARSLIAALRAYAVANGLPAFARTVDINVNGKPYTFHAYALKDANGAETNYVKLRDVADALRNSPAKFSVDWDGNVIIRTGEKHVNNGTEWGTPFRGDRDYTRSAAQTIVDGTAVQMDAILLTDDEGNGYTYYKLRDLGKVLGFNVGWDKERGVFVEADKPYDPAN